MNEKEDRWKCVLKRRIYGERIKTLGTREFDLCARKVKGSDRKEMKEDPTKIKAYRNGDVLKGAKIPARVKEKRGSWASAM
jgi:hypothetical protein